MSMRPTPVRALTVDSLRTEVYASRELMGAAAAYDVAQQMRSLLEEQERVRMVFAAAPSQDEFLAALASAEGVAWSRVEAFHMDEYIGLPENAPQSFARFLHEHIWDLVRPGRLECINGRVSDAAAECQRYTALLQERPIDIVCAGIGENGHMAFNDPPVADFEDPETIKVVTLDDTCRMQQVHDGAFARFEDVPETALSLTMPALMSARWLYCIVPGSTKTAAVRATLNDQISTACPATIMRRHKNATLYLDTDAAASA